jgi:hypothetical protein
MSNTREFRRLTKIWTAAKMEMLKAEAEMDAAVIDFMEGKGEKITRTALETLCEIRHEEFEARGALDQFIEENCC